jgi:hypothetical protein
MNLPPMALTLVLEQLAKVDESGRLFQSLGLQHLQLVRDVRLIYIAEGDDLYVGHAGPGIYMAGSPAAAADDGNPDRVVGAGQSANRRAARHHRGAH